MERIRLASQLAEDVGAYLRGAFVTPHDIRGKADGSIVTEVDIEAERRIREAIQRRFLDDAIVGEEGGGNKHAQEEGITWYVDPLDGTSNYAAGLPLFAVSLAYADAAGVQGAAIALPMSHELFYATRGEGAFRNGARISMRKSGDKKKPLFLVSYAHAVQHDERISRFLALRPRPGMRVLGSTVAALCWLAAGAAGGGVLFGQHAWDYAGGAFIAQEAGGRVETISGDPLTLPLDQDVAIAEAESFQIIEAVKSRIFS